MLLGDILAHGARIRPGRTALVADAAAVTYRDLARGADAYAAALRAQGIRKGDRVAVLTRSTPAYVELLFAVTREGGVLVPLNPLLIARELRTIILDAEARFLLFEAEFAATADAIRPSLAPESGCLCLDRPLPGYPHLAGGPAPGAAPPAGEPPCETDIALQIYAGGTSGQPRGAMLSHRNLFAAAASAAIELGLSHEDIFLSCSPLPVLLGTGRLLRFLLVGATIVLMKEFAPGEALRAIERNRVTHALFTATMMAQIVDLPNAPRRDLSSLRKIVYRGAFVNIDLLRRAAGFFGCDLVRTYGPIESSGILTFLHAEDHAFDGSVPSIRRLASVGREAVGVEVRVVDDRGRDIGPNQVGEVIARGPNVFRGYFGDPGFTAEVLRDGWLYTGDLASIDDEGYVFVVDRKRDTLMIGGISVYPKEIENVIAEHPAVGDVAVVGRPDDTWGEIPAAVVVLKAGRKADAESILAHCRENMAPFKVPRSIEIVPSLPRNSQGKVLKAKLKERRLGRGPARPEIPSAGSAPPPPRTPRP
ncbi:MAG: AMP-binding protein [Gemmatimonadota bacterium]